MNCSVSARRSVSRTTWPTHTGGRRSCLSDSEIVFMGSGYRTPVMDPRGVGLRGDARARYFSTPRPPRLRASASAVSPFTSLDDCRTAPAVRVRTARPLVARRYPPANTLAAMQARDSVSPVYCPGDDRRKYFDIRPNGNAANRVLSLRRPRRLGKGND